MYSHIVEIERERERERERGWMEFPLVVQPFWPYIKLLLIQSPGLFSVSDCDPYAKQESAQCALGNLISGEQGTRMVNILQSDRDGPCSSLVTEMDSQASMVTFNCIGID